MITIEISNDVEALKSIFLDPVVYKNIADDSCPSFEQAQFNLNPGALYLLCKEDGIPIGVFTLYKKNAITAVAHMAFVKRGVGCAKEAGELAKLFIKEKLGLKKLTGETPETNEKALKLARKIGFRNEGYSPKSILKNGKLIGTCLSGLEL